MRAKPYGYRKPDYAERYFGITTMCHVCVHSEPPPKPNARHRCHLETPGQAVAQFATCSFAAPVEEKVKP